MDWNQILNLKTKIKPSSRQREIIKENWERILTNVARKIPMDIIAKEIGVGERTLWRVLKELGLSTQLIVKSYEEMRKKKEEKTKIRLEKVKAPPISLTQFKELEIIKEFIKYCLSRRRLSKRTINHYLGVLYRICKELNVHPESLNKDIIESYLDRFISELGELVREESYSQKVSNIISILRTFSEFRGFTISHKTIEYSGEWNVYFTLEDRRKLVDLSHKMFDEDMADFVVTMMEYYFVTGARAKSIVNIIDIKNRNDGYVELYVREKGKRKYYVWKKIIPLQLYERLKKYLPITEKQIKKLRMLLTKLYARYFGVEDMVNEIKSSTLLGYRVVYRNGKEEIVETPLSSRVLEKLRKRVGIEKYRLVYYCIRHPIHIWRHTFAIEMLEHTGYNYEVVSVLGGWVKVNTLERVYGKLEYDKAYAIAFGKFERKPFRFI